MWVQRYIYFVVLLWIIQLSFIECNKIHKRFTNDEVLEVFGTDLNSVPDYEVVQVWHTLNKRDKNGELILKSYGREVKLYLQPADKSSLVGTNTPVWLAYGQNAYNVQYTKLHDFILRDVLRFHLDPKSRASIATLETDDGLTILGTIGNRLVRSLPARFTRDVVRKNGHIFSDYGRPHSADPEKNYTIGNHHVVFTTPNPRSNFLAFDGYHFNNKTGTRSPREIPKIIYPELLVIMDYAINFTSPQDPRLFKFLMYTLAFWNGVDLRFRELKDPEVRLRINGIIIATNRAAAPWMSENVVNGIVNVDIATDKVVEYFQSTQQKTYFPSSSYDVLVTVSNQLLCRPVPPDNSECNNRLSGISANSRIGRCTNRGILSSETSCIITEDTGYFNGIGAVVHEIGHTLGAHHDGENGAEACSSVNGYIMAVTDKYHENNLIWSSCSRQRISQVTSTKMNCLRNSERVQNPGSPLPPILPGDLTTLDEICQSRGWEWACAGREGNCAALHCWNSGFFSGFTTAWSCQPTARPPEGSVCALGKNCLNGECVKAYSLNIYNITNW